MEVRKIFKGDFEELAFKYHYSVSMPRHTKHYLGCFEDNRLVGALSLGWGTQPQKTIKKLFPLLDTSDYYEIGKMAMLDEMPRNSETRMLSLVIKWMKKNTDAIFLFTWADGIVVKVGYVYQAANFFYGGFIWTDIFITKDGEKLHPRSTKKLLVENQEFSKKEKLFWLTHDYCKHKGIRRIKGKQFRYIYPLTKSAKEMMMNSSTVSWTVDNHPKDDALLWKEQVGSGEYIEINNPPEYDKSLSLPKDYHFQKSLF